MKFLVSPQDDIVVDPKSSIGFQRWNNTKPHLLRSMQTAFETLCGQCITVSFFKTVMVYLSTKLLHSLVHIHTSPFAAFHFPLYTCIESFCTLSKIQRYLNMNFSKQRNI